MMTSGQQPIPSTRPYLIRAVYDWCSDNGFTPHIAVAVDDSVTVPREYVKDSEIILNISMTATGGLHLGNEAIRFQARFAGKARDIYVPVGRVMAIFARENSQGMSFPMTEPPVGYHPPTSQPATAQQARGADALTPPKPKGGLTRVK